MPTHRHARRAVRRGADRRARRRTDEATRAHRLVHPRVRLPADFAGVPIAAAPTGRYVRREGSAPGAAASQGVPADPGNEKLGQERFDTLKSTASAEAAKSPTAVAAGTGIKPGRALSGTRPSAGISLGERSGPASPGRGVQGAPEVRPMARRGGQATVFRLVSSRTNCPANVNGAPADPAADLADMDLQAGAIAAGTASLLTIAGALTTAGFRNPNRGVDQAYQQTFGLPVARPGGFLNRMTGVVRPTLDAALGEEMTQLAQRFDRIARFFGQPIPYRCGIPDSFGGCPQTAASCAGTQAESCAGVGAIFLCPPFWAFGTAGQAAIAIHEAAHIHWSNVGEGARGPGGSFRAAECYASLAAQIFNVAIPPTGRPCIPPPP